jgi:hypothetical protein
VDLHLLLLAGFTGAPKVLIFERPRGFCRRSKLAKSRRT